MGLSEPQLTCRFAHRGFAFTDGNRVIPCRTRYHLGCVKVGVPFRTRLSKNKGLELPLLKDFPGFICEACTVRAVVDRELGSGPSDYALLMLERMRLLDTINSLAPGTHASYQQKISYLRKFEMQFQVPILTVTSVPRPPSPASIPLMWAQQHYSLQQSRWKRSKGGTEDAARVTFATVRGLRSAASLFHKLDMLTAHPGKVYMDPNNRVMTTNDVSPTDELGYTMMNTGMKNRLGTESKPSVALMDRHIRYLDSSLRRRFLGATTRAMKLELARAGFANSMAWLAWLRAKELFLGRWCDIDLTRPGDGEQHDLPAAIGVIGLRLLDQTKSERSKTADVVVAHTTVSGLSAGFWLETIMSLLELDIPDLEGNTTPIFQHQNGSAWDSRYFRQTFLWPSLHEQRLAGDVALRPYIGSPGNSIEEKFWSMHSYRRGGRSQVSRRRPGIVRAASKLEVVEHGRWRVKRSSLDMPTAYLEWSIADRIPITLLCM